MKRIKQTSIKIRPKLEKEMKFLLNRGMTKNQIVNEALREYLIEQEFEMIRKKCIPFAQSKGLYTDEDVEKFLQ